MEELNQQNQQQGAEVAQPGEYGSATGIGGDSSGVSLPENSSYSSPSSSGSGNAAEAESATGEPAGATAQASSETTGTASSGADVQPDADGHAPASNASSDESPTGATEGSTTGGEAEQEVEPHPVRTYADILRGKFQRAEAVALSDIERLLDLIEEHL